MEWGVRALMGGTGLEPVQDQTNSGGLVVATTRICWANAIPQERASPTLSNSERLCIWPSFGRGTPRYDTAKRDLTPTRKTHVHGWDRTPALHGGGTGSNPVWALQERFGQADLA
jgi:hypothetical protein